MSFQQKSTWAMFGTMLFVYGGYFLSLRGAYLAAPGQVLAWDYRDEMLAAVICLVVIAIVAHIVIALFGPDETDERDRAIERMGDYVGGYVLGAGSLTAMGMAMFELPHFWIANMILLGLVLGELVGGAVKLVYYHRGY